MEITYELNPDYRGLLTFLEAMALGDRWKEFHDYFINNTWLAGAEHGDDLVGLICLHGGKQSQAHVAQLRLLVHPDYRRRGIGRWLVQAAQAELFQTHDFVRIEATPWVTNWPCLGLLLSEKFELEGRRSLGARSRGGHYSDTYSLAWTG